MTYNIYHSVYTIWRNTVKQNAEVNEHNEGTDGRDYNWIRNIDDQFYPVSNNSLNELEQKQF